MAYKNGIGILKESSLHASLKQWYFEPGDQLEQKVDGSIVDLVRGDLCVEFQTKHLYAIQRKVKRLCESHPVRIVYPMTYERYILRIDINTDRVISRRKSPRRTSLFDVFTELVRITQLIQLENFSLEVVFIREEQVLVQDRKGSWRRKGWSVSDRRLIEVVSSCIFKEVDDYKIFIPEDLPKPFTVKELASAIHQPRQLANKMAYSLRELNLIEYAGRKGRAYLYTLPAIDFTS